MTTVTRTALLPYAAADMYRLINDVSAYPQFLPYCQAAEVQEQGADWMQASLTLAHGPLRQSFTTRNALHPHERVDVALVSGPFQSLQGGWRFEALGEAGCKLSLRLDFEFSSAVTGQLFAKLFNEVAVSLVEAFSRRAAQLYGSAE